jgi:hypothetical protein
MLFLIFRNPKLDRLSWQRFSHIKKKSTLKNGEKSLKTRFLQFFLGFCRQKIQSLRTPLLKP